VVGSKLSTRCPLRAAHRPKYSPILDTYFGYFSYKLQITVPRFVDSFSYFPYELQLTVTKLIESLGYFSDTKETHPIISFGYFSDTKETQPMNSDFNSAMLTGLSEGGAMISSRGETTSRITEPELRLRAIAGSIPICHDWSSCRREVWSARNLHL
jgi:hypothetical protein